MQKVCNISVIVSRYLLGLVFVVFGLNGFFNFLPMPPMAEAPMAFIMALVNSGYVMKVVKVTEILVGLALLSGCYVPFAVVVITPIIVNITLFHTFLETSGAPMAYVMLLCWAIQVWAYRNVYRPMFACKATPTTC